MAMRFRAMALMLATWSVAAGAAPDPPAAVPAEGSVEATPAAVPRVFDVARAGDNAGDRATMTLKDGVEMAFRWCPAGTFTMGSPAGEPERKANEAQVSVTFAQGFWIAETEVTQAQWEAVVGANLSHFKGADHPVQNVSWTELMGKQDSGTPTPQAGSFLARASAMAGRTLTLPTEAQWEYACRAGTETPFHFGGMVSPEMVNYNGTHPYGESAKGLNRATTTPVGTFPANAWGLRDMHGNVWEWCADWYGENETGGVDPTGPPTGGLRVFKGGSWSLPAGYCRSAVRHFSNPEYRFNDYGFRPVVVPVVVVPDVVAPVPAAVQ